MDERLSFLKFPIEHIGPNGTVRAEAQERADFLKAQSPRNIWHEVLRFAAGADPDAPVADAAPRFRQTMRTADTSTA